MKVQEHFLHILRKTCLIYWVHKKAKYSSILECKFRQNAYLVNARVEFVNLGLVCTAAMTNSQDK